VVPDLQPCLLIGQLHKCQSSLPKHDGSNALGTQIHRNGSSRTAGLKLSNQASAVYRSMMLVTCSPFVLILHTHSNGSSHTVGLKLPNQNYCCVPKHDVTNMQKSPFSLILQTHGSGSSRAVGLELPNQTNAV
jgi:hypothetical protein